MDDRPDVNVTNNTTPTETRVVDREDSNGWVVAVIILAIIVLFLVFGLPRLRGGDAGGTGTNTGADVDVELPDVTPVTGGDTQGDGATEEN